MVKLKNKEIIVDKKYLIDTLKTLEGLKRKLQALLGQRQHINM